MADGGDVGVALAGTADAMTYDLELVHSFKGAVRHAQLGPGQDARLPGGLFPQGLQYVRESQEIAWVVNHNQTYVLLKHVVWPRKPAFLAYTSRVRDKIAGIRAYLQMVGRGGEA